MAKYFSSEAALENSIEIDAHPRRLRLLQGVRHRAPLIRDAPLTCIGEGTNEMQRIIIARQWIKPERRRMSAKPPSSKPLEGVAGADAWSSSAPGPTAPCFLAETGRRGDQGSRRPTAIHRAHVGPYKLGAGGQRIFPGVEPRQEEA